MNKTHRVQIRQTLSTLCQERQTPADATRGHTRTKPKQVGVQNGGDDEPQEDKAGNGLTGEHAECSRVPGNTTEFPLDHHPDMAKQPPKFDGTIHADNVHLVPQLVAPVFEEAVPVFLHDVALRVRLVTHHRFFRPGTVRVSCGGAERVACAGTFAARGVSEARGVYFYLDIFFDHASDDGAYGGVEEGTTVPCHGQLHRLGEDRISSEQGIGG
jgi:hypothetical protein